MDSKLIAGSSCTLTGMRVVNGPAYLRWPTLDALLASGVLYLDWDADANAGQYCGIASDGVEVCIGETGLEEGTERYLASNPTPDKW